MGSGLVCLVLVLGHLGFAVEGCCRVLQRAMGCSLAYRFQEGVEGFPAAFSQNLHFL